jgi:hypothetical protein
MGVDELHAAPLIVGGKRQRKQRRPRVLKQARKEGATVVTFTEPDGSSTRYEFGQQPSTGNDLDHWLASHANPPQRS